jgi:hypothetical protein
MTIAARVLEIFSVMDRKEVVPTEGFTLTDEFVGDGNTMKYSPQSSLVLGGFAVAAVLAALTVVLPSSAQASRVMLARPAAPATGTCSIEISTASLTPALAPDGSGGNILFNGTLASEPVCAKKAVVLYHNALQTGWSPANRCAIIQGTGPSDEIVTEITYIWNANPSVRVDGYGTMCHATTAVPAGPL